MEPHLELLKQKILDTPSLKPQFEKIHPEYQEEALEKIYQNLLINRVLTIRKEKAAKEQQ